MPALLVKGPSQYEFLWIGFWTITVLMYLIFLPIQLFLIRFYLSYSYVSNLFEYKVLRDLKLESMRLRMFSESAKQIVVNIQILVVCGYVWAWELHIRYRRFKFFCKLKKNLVIKTEIFRQIIFWPTQWNTIIILVTVFHLKELFTRTQLL